MIIKIVWETRGGHIHCAVFQGKGEGFTWEKVGDLVFDHAGFTAFTYCMQGKGTFQLVGKPYEDGRARAFPPKPPEGEMDTAPCLVCKKPQAEHPDFQYCPTGLDGDN